MAGDGRNNSLYETSMKKKCTSQSAFFGLRILISLVAILSGVFLALFATSAQVKRSERAAKLMPPSGGVQQEWIAFYNGGYGFDVAWGTAVDGSGNIYVTGSSVGPGPCNFYCNDYATIKYNAAGTQQWVARYNGPANDDDHPSAIAVDGSSNVYVTGASIGTTWPDYDYATVKYDNSGQQQWVARYNGPGNEMDFGNAIAVDASGNVYVTGSSRGSGGDFDYATVKYDSSGQEQWVARYNGPGNGDDEAYGIAVDASGNVYVTGYSGGSGTGNDFATIKYNSAGQEQWVARYNGPSNSDDYGNAIGIDGSGNVYVTGSSVDSVNGFDYATVKYDNSGQEQWAARYNGPGNQDDEPYAMAVDSSGNVYVTGYSTGSGTGYDYTTIKYNTSGTEEWVARYNGEANLLDIPLPSRWMPLAMSMLPDGASAWVLLGLVMITPQSSTTVPGSSSGLSAMTGPGILTTKPMPSLLTPQPMSM
jgi:sugar lactone lactonase YvrE